MFEHTLSLFDWYIQFQWIRLTEKRDCFLSVVETIPSNISVIRIDCLTFQAIAWRPFLIVIAGCFVLKILGQY
jgi:hypothetical protein